MEVRRNAVHHCKSMSILIAKFTTDRLTTNIKLVIN